jgi:hypothetical protein
VTQSFNLGSWPEHFEAYLFARDTGQRAGAQFNLRWNQIDMHERTVTLPKRAKSKYKRELDTAAQRDRVWDSATTTVISYAGEG